MAAHAQNNSIGGSGSPTHDSIDPLMPPPHNVYRPPVVATTFPSGSETCTWSPIRRPVYPGHHATGLYASPPNARAVPYSG